MTSPHNTRRQQSDRCTRKASLFICRSPGRIGEVLVTARKEEEEEGEGGEGGASSGRKQEGALANIRGDRNTHVCCTHIHNKHEHPRAFCDRHGYTKTRPRTSGSRARGCGWPVVKKHDAMPHIISQRAMSHKYASAPPPYCSAYSLL